MPSNFPPHMYAYQCLIYLGGSTNVKGEVPELMKMMMGSKFREQLVEMCWELTGELR